MYNSFNEVKKMKNGILLQGFHWYIKPEENLWKKLKENVDENTTVVDAKFLVCEYVPDQGVAKEPKTISEIVKLPVTFDSGTILFITLGIIVLALVIVAIIKRTNKKDENK